jgi:hypothetical protein
MFAVVVGAAAEVVVIIVVVVVVVWWWLCWNELWAEQLQIDSFFMAQL